MIDSAAQRRLLRAEIARLRRRIDRRVAPLVQSGRWVGRFAAWCCSAKPPANSDDNEWPADSNER